MMHPILCVAAWLSTHDAPTPCFVAHQALKLQDDANRSCPRALLGHAMSMVAELTFWLLHSHLPFA